MPSQEYWSIKKKNRVMFGLQFKKLTNNEIVFCNLIVVTWKRLYFDYCQLLNFNVGLMQLRLPLYFMLFETITYGTCSPNLSARHFDSKVSYWTKSVIKVFKMGDDLEDKHNHSKTASLDLTTFTGKI